MNVSTFTHINIYHLYINTDELPNISYIEYCPHFLKNGIAKNILYKTKYSLFLLTKSKSQILF